MIYKQNLIKRFLYIEGKTILNWNKLKPLTWAPHGHFYSPIVSQTDIDSFENQIWDNQNGIDGIDLRSQHQIDLLKELSQFYSEIPFTAKKKESNRYFYENDSFRYSDAILLHSMIRKFKPKRIIEIGSGFSSAIMLDSRASFGEIKLTFIEPYPALLLSLMKADDEASSEVLDTKVQNVDLNVFKKLQANDILFIDSSHVSKTGSDVNYEIFKILPALNPGVLIHFHDIFYPFEYPKTWVTDGRNWNESYLLRAFLSYNDKFEIQLFADYLHKYFNEGYKEMPLCYKDTGGSLWLKKI